MSNNLYYRCYILPIVGAITYAILMTKKSKSIFTSWVPDESYRIFTQSLIVFLVLFVTCRIMDIICVNKCHDDICYQSNDDI